MSEQPIRKLLFVCSMNKCRSLTAEKMLQRSDCYQVRSRGTAKGARIRLTDQDIGWADAIFTMEKKHTELIRTRFRTSGKPLTTLFIKDIYQPMEPALQDVLRTKLAAHILLPEAPESSLVR
ncbi:protein tyrosine phosphatase [Ruficoccus amylovorans]|uniref:Protein tyrosine phosphatase n=1 Tax=Ruficoccus amylovorans TaxID=1804625 RepID=A0A842HBK1_9BACT|nr:protein tyrosine phosphatase [Ruficoccus amylovorans]MBC2593086.1 protein tyrosine phosphatase [Ruficoccus amylovorans]